MKDFLNEMDKYYPLSNDTKNEIKNISNVRKYKKK